MQLARLFRLGIAVIALPASAEPLFLRNVVLVDAAARREIPDRAIVIEGDRIADIRSAKDPPPPGSRIVDGKGRFLIPGLWDMHVHALGIGRPDVMFPLFVACGVTSIRDMGSDSSASAAAALARETSSGVRVGPRIRAAPGRIADAGATTSEDSGLFVDASTPDRAREFVAETKRAGWAFVKVYNRLPRAAFASLAAEARRIGIPFAGHVPWSVTAVEASGAGMASIEHLTGAVFGCSSREHRLRRAGKNDWSSGEEAAASFDSLKCAALLDRFARNRTWQCPTLTLLARFAGERRPNDRVRSRFVPRSVRERVRSADRGGVRPEGVLWLRQLDLVRRMGRRAVGLLAGSDTSWSNPELVAGFALHDELELLVKAGLSPAEALQAATTSPARFLGLAAKTGSIAAGKEADLVLLDGDPLADIRNVRRVAAVVLRGRFFDERQLSSLRDRAAREADRR